MAKRIKDEVLSLNVVVNGNQAQAALIKIEKTQNDLKQSNKELRAEKARLELQNKKGSEEWKKVNAAIRENSSRMKINEAEMGKLIGKIGHTGLTVAQLEKKARDLRRSIKNMIPNTPEVKQKEQELRLLEKRLDEVNITSRRTGAALHRMNTGAVSGFKSATASLGRYMAGYAAMLISVTAIGRKWLEVNVEFEKFNAVLTTATGSAEAAAGEMNKIRDFAQKTPFSVRELTEAFVKLNNQGFRPTKDELTLLGDLASSTGKTFDQLAEAILDAQVGEFERLKEFGIKAKTEGDKVIFTFKGVRTEVGKNAEEIQKYILGLGNLEGVSGSMASISNTLGGALSNLGDAWENLLVSFSDGEGILSKAVGWLTDITNGISKSIQAGGLVSGTQINEATKAAADLYDSTLSKINKSIDTNKLAWQEWQKQVKNGTADSSKSVKSNLEAWQEWQVKIKEAIDKNKALVKSDLSMTEKIELSLTTGVSVAELMKQDKLTAGQTLLLNEKIKAYEQLAAVINANIDAEVKGQQKKEQELSDLNKAAAAKKLQETQEAEKQLQQFLQGIRNEDLTAVETKYNAALDLLKKFYSDETKLSKEQLELKKAIEKKFQEELNEEKQKLAEEERNKVFEKQKELLESNFQQLHEAELLEIEQQYANREITQQQFNDKMYQAELDHIDRMINLYKLLGISTVELERNRAKLLISNNESITASESDLRKERYAQIAASGLMAIAEAKNAEDRKRAILESIRDIIAAYIAETITKFVKDEISDKGWVGILTGAAGAALVNSLFNAVIPSFDGGMYDVIDDKGDRYRARQNEDLPTGMYTQPTFSRSKNMLVAEKRPELVVDGLTTQRLINFRPDVIDAIKQEARGVRGYANGNYPGNTGPLSPSPGGVPERGGGYDPEMKALLYALMKKMDQPSFALLPDKTVKAINDRNALEKLVRDQSIMNG